MRRTSYRLENKCDFAQVYDKKMIHAFDLRKVKQKCSALSVDE